MAEQVPEGSASAQIYSEFPHWFKHQVRVARFLKQIVVIKIDVTLQYCHTFVGL